MKRIVAVLNQRPYLKFFASVKLAVPLMLILALVVAVGTVLESRYNTDYAKLAIYHAWWFNALLMALWINIFLSTLSRYPFKARHTGFVITHIGLLTLLIGGMVTGYWGIDGQLRVVEGDRNAVVVLGDLSFELTDIETNASIRVPFAKSLFHLKESQLDFINSAVGSKILAREFIPFADVRSFYADNETGPESIALGFMLRSQFFNVSEWVHSLERPEMSMGPATIRLVVDREDVKAKPSKPSPAPQGPERLIVMEPKSEKVLAEFAVDQLRAGLQLPGGVVIAQLKRYAHAVVADNRLSEGDQPGANPALELMLSKGGEAKREVLYAKFPNFSLNQLETFGLRMRYQKDAGERQAASLADEPSQASGSRAGNVIEFHASSANPEKVRVELYKNDKLVMKENLTSGDSITTPWMGMKLTLGSVKRNTSEKIEVTQAPLRPRADLPPSAVFVTPAGASADQGAWLLEGQSRRVTLSGRDYEVYFGRKTLELPFSLSLLEFTKTDYPGTETPMSFESQVQVNGQGEKIRISMNEPLKYDGYTLYQASYDVRPGQPKASIFSVNNDPGRNIKYAGSLILALGIVIFTVSKSRRYQNWIQQRQGTHA